VSKNYEVLRQAGKDLALFRNKMATPSEELFGTAVLNGDRRIREEIMKLVQRTFLAPAGGARRVVVFTGVDHGNGCSWVCARAAEALAANVEGTVCVVEGNVRTQSLHRYFGVSRSSFLADTVLQHGPVQGLARPIRGTNLWLVSRWALPSDLSQDMGARQLEARFGELCASFGYVLVDAPPVNESAESLMFARMSEGVVLVLAANATRREAARKAKETLEAARVKLLGAVLNKRTYPIPEALYSRI